MISTNGIEFNSDFEPYHSLIVFCDGIRVCEQSAKPCSTEMSS